MIAEDCTTIIDCFKSFVSRLVSRNCLIQVVALASETFNYTPIDKAKAKSVKFATERFPDTLGKNMKAGLPPKVREVVVIVPFLIQ